MVMIGGKDYSMDEISVLEKAGIFDQIGQKNNPQGSTANASPLNGPFQGATPTQGGMYSLAGGRPSVFSALTRPNSWLSICNIEQSVFATEILDTQTGQTVDGTSNATNFCGNPPEAGVLKTARQTYVWGSFYGKTRLNSPAQMGQLKDRGDMARNILNAPQVNNPFLPDILQKLTDTRSQLANELYTFGVAMERSTEVVSVAGTALADNSRYGWFQEFKGLDGLIKTGHTDSVTGLAAAALDSVVVSFNAAITSTAAGGDGRTFTEALDDTMYALEDRARQVGMGGAVQWVIVMRQEMFRKAVEVQAQKYWFYKISGAQYNEINGTATDMQNLRLSMLNGSYLLVKGQQVPVVFTEGAEFTALGSGNYKSDMFIVPVSWGGVPLLRLQYFNMENSYTQEFVNFMGNTNIKTINNGMMLVGQRDLGLCLEFHFQSRMRLILDTPWLAARLDDISFSYVNVATRTALPGTSLYVNGGVSYRAVS